MDWSGDMSKFTLFLVLGFLAHNVFCGSRDEGDTSLGRLPTDLSPIHYVLELQPDIYTGAPPFFFNGSVSIRFVCEVATSVVYLNSDGLNIDGSSLNITVAPDSPVTAPDPEFVKYEEDDVLQFLKIFVDDNLVEGAEYLLDISFSGSLKSPVTENALFWSSYVSIVDGSTHYVASTQFQPHGARLTFPCFDEPMFKATHDITILRSPDVISVSNGILLRSEERGNGWVADIFNTTLKMSVYLVCFAIGEFDYLESYTSSGTRVRVYGRPEYMQDLAFAHDIAASFQDWYETWTGMVNPTDKVDHIAIPGKGGAMENWGLITYGESSLMYNATTNYVDDSRFVASLVGHELAHFWFGNLVTTRWWDDIWLNEGIATYFQELPYEDILGWDVGQSAMEFMGAMLRVDGRKSAFPVKMQIDSPWQAGLSFSGQAYGKGAGLMRMIRQFLGNQTFQKGLQRYLSAHAYGNVVTDDLWDALTEQAEIDGVTDTDGSKLFVKEKMDPWIYQKGSPLVTVTRTAPRTANASQNYFLNPPNQSPPPSLYEYEWYVPLTITNEQTHDWSTDTKDWLNRENKTITSGLPDSMDQWFVVNLARMGFYRVKYDNESYMRLVDQLDVNSTIFHPLSRYAILDDAIEVARSGMELETFALEATRFLDQEDVLIVWDAAENQLEYLSLILDRYQSTYSLFQQYFRTKIDPAYTRFGWDNGNDDVLRQEARALLQKLACNFGNPDCQQNAVTRFLDFLANPTENRIPPDQRATVYCTGIATGNEADWDFLHSQYLSLIGSPLRGSAAEIDRILTSLACTLNDTLLWRYINYTFDSEKIEPSDADDAIDAIANSARGRWIMWQNLQNNWNNTPTPSGVSKLNTLETVVEGFATEEDISQLEAFISMYPPQNADESETYDDALETATTNKQWADRNLAALDVWFTEHTELPPGVHSESYFDKRASAVNIRLKPRLLKSKMTKYHGEQSLMK